MCLGHQRGRFAIIKTGYTEGLNEREGYMDREKRMDLGDVGKEVVIRFRNGADLWEKEEEELQPVGLKDGEDGGVVDSDRRGRNYMT